MNRLMKWSGPAFAFRVLIAPFVMFTFLRFLWAWYNADGLTSVEWDDYGLAYLVGLRYDAATAAIYCGLASLAAFFPVHGRRNTPAFQRWLAIALLIVGLMTAMLFNIVDIGYFRFAARRGASDLISIPGDVGRAGGGIIREYWRLALLWLTLGGFTFWWLAKAKAKRLNLNYFQQWIFWLALGGLYFVAGRGGFHTAYLRPELAFFSERSEAGHMAGNSGYLVAFALMEDVKSPTTLMADEEAARLARNEFAAAKDTFLTGLDYPFWRKMSFADTAPQPQSRPNVLVLVMESLTSRYVGVLNGQDSARSLTPHFDRYARQGLLFDNFYANGTRSIEAFSGVLNGTPEVLGQFIISSPAEKNKNHALGKILKENGYQTAFFHGTYNGSMLLDRFSATCGFDKYYGLNEYPANLRPQHFDGEWGVFDHHFFHFMYEELAKTQQPFGAVAFSCSHHHPFSLPREAEFDDLRSAPLTLPERTLKYSDRALGSLLDKITADPRFANTLILVTGDHTFLFQPQDRRHALDQFRIPLLVLAPGRVQPGVSHVVGKHCDLPPTVLQLAGIETKASFAGVSLLQDSPQRSALFGLGGLFTFVTDSLALTTNFAGYESWLRRAAPAPAFDYRPYEPAQPLPLPESRHSLRAAAYYQATRNALLQDRWVAP